MKMAYLGIQLASSVVVPNAVIEVPVGFRSMSTRVRLLLRSSVAPLNATQLLISLFRGLRLHSDHRLETRIKVRDTQLKELGEFTDELFIEHVENFFGIIMFLLGLSILHK